MNLHLKYRPTTFDDMVGNTAELASLKAAMERPDRPHVVLLSGQTGGGKTTAARIMAKQLGVSDIAIQEINAANARGIDTAREIIETTRGWALDGSPWAFILDECHRFTADFQNAILKPLEDTPGHVYFFLCTTDPQKLIAPLKNRCFQVTLKPVETGDLFLLLKRVQRAEGTDLDRDTLMDICTAANGSPRSALQIMSKVLQSTDPEERRELARSTIPDDEAEDVIGLCRALLKAKSWAEVKGPLATLDAAEPERVRQAVLSYMTKVLLSSDNPRAALVLEAFAEPFFNSGKAGIVLAAYQSIA